jgi:hypothetical protein
VKATKQNHPQFIKPFILNKNKKLASSRRKPGSRGAIHQSGKDLFEQHQRAGLLAPAFAGTTSPYPTNPPFISPAFSGIP